MRLVTVFLNTQCILCSKVNSTNDTCLNISQCLNIKCCNSIVLDYHYLYLHKSFIQVISVPEQQDFQKPIGILSDPRLLAQVSSSPNHSCSLSG